MKHTYKYDHYYKYQEIVDIMMAFARENPDYVKLDVIGQSYEGRDIYLMEITDLSTGGFDDKPAYYVEGNIHAGEVTGSMSVMYLMDTLLSNKEEGKIAALLDRNTFYLLPRVSPDGSEYYLTTPYTVRSSVRPYPFLQEMPGLQPRDLDGDGIVRTMRVKTPYGMWKVSDLDPRIMTKRCPDDTDGDFYNLYSEGEILDYDGVNIENGPALKGYDFNRNYPIGWQPDWVQRGAGETPMCNPETRANADFLMSHKNICSVVDMHTYSGLVLYTPGYMSGRQANQADQALYRALGKIAVEETGYKLLQLYDQFMEQSAPATYGGFDDFCHFTLGVPAITIECWDIQERCGMDYPYPPDENEPEETRVMNEYKLLKWIDANVSPEEGFKPWTAFEHPQLGTVEIGGICNKFLTQNPPPAFLEEDIAKHVNFMLREAAVLPRISFDEVKKEKLAEGLYKISVTVGNRGFMPTYVFEEALKNRALPEITVTLAGAEEIVEGKEETRIGQLAGFANYYEMSWNFPATTIPTKPLQKKVSWILRAEEDAELTVTVEGWKIGKKTITVS